jgi:hypothetical protein
MTVEQRKALAAAWLEESGAGASSNSAVHMTDEEHNTSDSSNSSEGSDDEQNEALETWMVLEFCEKGSLQWALSQGHFKRSDSAQPDMVSSARMAGCVLACRSCCLLCSRSLAQTARSCQLCAVCGEHMCSMAAKYLGRSHACCNLIHE